MNKLYLTYYAVQYNNYKLIEVLYLSAVRAASSKINYYYTDIILRLFKQSLQNH
jgi:hypothetical protein